jgi:hypothetical protein
VVDAPLGLFVVCFDSRDEVIVRVLDTDERLLMDLLPNAVLNRGGSVALLS